MTNQGPQDLAARFAFGRTSRVERERAARREREAQLIAWLRSGAPKTDADALATIRSARIGTVRKQELCAAWREGRI